MDEILKKQDERSKVQIAELQNHVLKVATSLKTANVKLNAQGDRVDAMNDGLGKHVEEEVEKWQVSNAPGAGLFGHVVKIKSEKKLYQEL